MSKPITVLAFDWGQRQIGVAVGNTLTQAAQPLRILRARDGVPDWQQVAAVIAEWQPAQLVVGEPLNMDDTPATVHARAVKFARRLEGRFSLPVTLVDERLSSVEAKAALREQGHGGDYHRQPADSVAAALILDTWFASDRDNDRGCQPLRT